MHGLIDTMDSLIVGPTREPLDLDEVKKHLRFGSTTEDTLIDAWISAARQHFEEQTGRQIMTATWEYWLAGSPYLGVVELPHPQLQSIVSITYDDSDGEEQTVSASDYAVAAPAGPTCRRGRVSLGTGGSWPSITGDTKANAIRIRYKAGYGDTPGDVPELVKSALYLMVAHFHKFRAEVHEGTQGSLTQLPLGAEAILRNFKWSALPSLHVRTYCMSTSSWV